MFETRFKTTLTLFFLALALATSFLIGATTSATAATRAGASSAPDFSLAANPTSRTIPRGQTAIYTIHVQGLGGFHGTVSFTVTGVPNHDSGFFTNESVTGTGDTELHVHSAGHQSPIGTSTLTVTGTGGSLSHAIQVTYTVAFIALDFALSANPISQTIHRGGTAIYAIHVQALNGFNGTVNLTVSGVPSPDSGFLTNGSVTGTGDTELHIQSAGDQSPIGTSLIFVTGVSGGLSHTLQLTYQVISW